MTRAIKRMLSNLYNLSLREVVNRISSALSFQRSRPAVRKKAKEIREELLGRFEKYQTSNLYDISVEDFCHYIKSHIGVIDAQAEGYGANEVERQRDQYIKFYWGHNHDFGSFKQKGRMGKRHIDLLATFIALFPVSFDDFQDKEVFDIGC